MHFWNGIVSGWWSNADVRVLRRALGTRLARVVGVSVVWLGLGLGLGCGVVAGAASAPAGSTVFQGCCDASAAVALNESVIAVGSDEENVIRLYRRDTGGAPVGSWPAAGAPGPALGREEMDLEGAARLDDLAFWIGSHSRNSNGRPRPSRHVVFATRIMGEGLGVGLETAGRPFRSLLASMAADAGMARFGLARAAERPAEAAGGLNIEALAAGSDGALWVGFRNPVPERKALMACWLNPKDVVMSGAPPRWGAPVLLPLGGLGLRDAARVGTRILLVAGPAEGGGRHRLFAWTEGSAVVTEMPGTIPKGFQAESIVPWEQPGAERIQLLSDGGGDKIGGIRCADLRDPMARLFRGITVVNGAR